MIDYANGKIYKLTNGGLTYYGSTTLTKEKRFEYHHCPSNRLSSKRLFELGGIVKIDIIEYYPCNSLYELEDREAYYIRKYFDDCVNIIIPHRTQKEYCYDNRVRIASRSKKYKNNHKDVIALQTKEYQINYREYANKAKRWKRTYFGQLCKMYLI